MTLVKTKGVSTGNDDLKQAELLSKKALTRLNMQTPELTKFVVAFKDLSQELPENTGIQVGMAILDIKGAYIYVPILAKGGEVQIIESMFDASTKKFIPLTRKSVKWLIGSGHELGRSERIPGHVARDPDLYDAIVPPKTGKFVYASEGRLGGFFASMPNHIKEATFNIINDDYELQQALAPVMDIDLITEFLERGDDDAPDEMGPPAPTVVTSAEGLTQEQVQEIMAKGYTVVNPPKSTRVAVESSTSGYGALTRLGSVIPGTAVSAVKRNGSWTSVASLKMAKKYTNDDLYADGSPLRNRDCEPDTGVVAITEQGEVLINPNIVTCAAECSYDAVIEKLPCKRATDISIGDYGLIFTGTGFYGPFKAQDVVKSNGWTTIDTPSHRVMIHPSIKSMGYSKGTDMILNDSAMFYPAVPGCDLMETDIGVAEVKVNADMERMLPYSSSLMHRDGVYAVDGKEVGGKPQIVEHLLKHWEIDVPSVETFVKRAEESTKVIVKMAAVRDGGRASPGSGTKVQPHYQHGDQPGSDDMQLTGNARQRAIGMSNSSKAVKDVSDREVMEATIISEMLQNPDLAGSIREYLPEIRTAVDRLGRSLFLMRINTDKLNDSVDAEALNNLFTATRNAYRILGENCVTLENLSNNELD